MPDNDKIIYLLGAGFTHAVMGKAALLNDEIMDSLDSNDFLCFKDEFEAAKPNIEQFLTLVDLKCLRYQQEKGMKNEELEQAQNNIKDSISSMVDIDKLSVSSLEEKPVLKYFVDSVPVGSCLISLNYDCVLDQGLWFSHNWHPADGYCLSAFPGTTDGHSAWSLLKVHGSCSFRIPKGKGNSELVAYDENYFPGINAHINTSWEKRRVVTMSYIKSFSVGLMGIWRRAISEITKGDNLVIIGCSIREEDAFLKFALHHFGMKEKNNNENFNIHIVDIKSKTVEEIESKVKQLVARPRQHTYTLHSKGLEGYLDDIRQN